MDFEMINTARDLKSEEEVLAAHPETVEAFYIANGVMLGLVMVVCVVFLCQGKTREAKIMYAMSLIGAFWSFSAIVFPYAVQKAQLIAIATSGTPAQQQALATLNSFATNGVAKRVLQQFAWWFYMAGVAYMVMQKPRVSGEPNGIFPKIILGVGIFMVSIAWFLQIAAVQGRISLSLLGIQPGDPIPAQIIELLKIGAASPLVFSVGLFLVFFVVAAYQFKYTGMKLDAFLVGFALIGNALLWFILGLSTNAVFAPTDSLSQAAVFGIYFLQVLMALNLAMVGKKFNDEAIFGGVEGQQLATVADKV